MDPRLRTTIATSSLFLILLAPSCGGSLPGPTPGLPLFQQLGLVRVPGGLANAVGGNLVLSRTDLSIDTRIGTRELGATYNSVDRAWLWSFDVSLIDGVFRDSTGASHDIGGLSPGERVAGTHWRKRGPSSVESLGGLVHEFGGSGRLVAVHWASDPYPRLVYRAGLVADVVRIVAIEQCVAASSCVPVFDLAYDAAGRLIEASDRAGRRASFGWDAAGGLAWARSALDEANGWLGERYEYDGEGRLRARVTSENERVEYDYAGDRVAAVRPIGLENPVYRFEYEKLGEAVFETRFVGPEGDEAHFRWGPDRTVSRVRWPRLDEELAYAWEGRDLTGITGAAGERTTIARPSPNVVQATLPDGATVVFEYQPGGVNRSDPWRRALALVSDDLGIRRLVGYDAAGRVTSTTNALGEGWTASYDALGQPTTFTDTTGRTLSFLDYREDGHPRIVELDGEIAEERSYDTVGNLLRGSEPDDPYATSAPGIVERTFDANRNLASIAVWGKTDGADSVGRVEIERRSDGRILEIRRPEGGDARFDYDALGRLTARRTLVDGSWNATTFEYDALGRRVAETRANGMRREVDLDDLGRVVEVRNLTDLGLESHARLQYEAGRLVSVFDSVRGGSDAYLHDSAGRVSEIRFADGEVLELGRDARSRIVEAAFRLPTGETLTTLSFAYDALDRDVSVWKDGDLLLSREFLNGRLHQVDYGNGLQRQLDHGKGGPGTVFAEAVTLDPEGAVVELSRIETGFLGDIHASWTQTSTLEVAGVGTSELSDFAFLDRAGTVSGEEVAFGALLGQIVSTSFDTLGNLLGTPVSALVYNDEHNRLTRIEERETGAPIREYAYDAAGFVVAIDGVPIEWTAHGRVRSVGTSASFVWDARGLPVSQSIGGETTHWMFGGLVQTDEVRAPAAIDLTEVRIDLQEGAHLYRHLDVRGNVKFVSNATGEIVSAYGYGPFGESRVVGSSADAVRFAQGSETDGLVVLGERVYDPMAGRFLSPDPVYHLYNQFSYPPNPVWFWDPDGRRLDAIGFGFGVASFVATIAALAVPAAAVSLAAVSIAFGALALATAATQLLIDHGIVPSPQTKELTLSCACAGGGGGAAGVGGGSDPRVAGPSNGPLVVIEGHAFKNGRYVGKAGGPDSAFGTGRSAGSGGASCLHDTNTPSGGCASVLPLPMLWVFARSRARRRGR